MRFIDPTSKAIINGLQGGFPLCPRPFHEAGAQLGLSEGELIDGIRDLIDTRCLSRFGPLWHAEELGGQVCLAAMAVPRERFDAVAAQVNAHIEVAHNYERSHALNMWFVLSAERQNRIAQVIAEIERETGLAVHPMPKLREFYVGFRVDV
jgi:siroheme decarboxylase